MTYDVANFARVLKNHGYSFTKPRKAVFDALYDAESLTIHELVKLLPAIDRASIYRTIELFEKLGIAHRIQIGWKYKLELSDAFQNHHHHMTCICCGAVTVLPENSIIEKEIDRIGTSTHFTITDHQLEIRGTCHSCGGLGESRPRLELGSSPA